MKMISTDSLSITVLLLVTAVAAVLDEDLLPLSKAARDGRLDDVNSALADPEVNIDWQDRWGGTALQEAAGYNHIAVVQTLVNAGANINVKDDEGYTPINTAMGRGSTELVTLLIGAGADVDTPSIRGMTPLMRAARYGKPSNMAALISAGANITLADENGNTALHWATSTRGNQAIITMLLQAGAPTGARNGNGLTPAEQARVEGKNKLGDMINDFITATTTTTNSSVWQLAGYLCGLSVFFVVICV